MEANDQDYTDNDCKFTINYWKCPCGKTNSEHYETCVKCGKLRPMLCTSERIGY